MAQDLAPLTRDAPAKTPTDVSAPWALAELAAAIVAIAGASIGGVRVIARNGPVRSAWLEELNRAFPETPPIAVPLSVDRDRLVGGLSVDATLRAGKPVYETGLIAAAEGRALVLRMAERTEDWVAATLAARLDEGTTAKPPPIVILLDEGADTDEAPPNILLERVGLTIDLSTLSHRDIAPFRWTGKDIAAAKPLFEDSDIAPEWLTAFTQAALALGYTSLRKPIFCAAAARAVAAFHGRKDVCETDAALACQLVLGGVPNGAPETSNTDPAPDVSETPQSDGDDGSRSDGDSAVDDLTERMIAAALAARLQDAFETTGRAAQRRRGGISGKSGQIMRADDKGAPARPRPRRARGHGRLDLIQTLRKAAPWQPLRKAETRQTGPAIRPSDLQIKQFKRRSQSSVIFIVDASGSAAMHRLGEAKGAVEHLLSDCYARRDMVSVIAFRGEAADLLLPPTRSLVRVQRSLGNLPGGGATPLADAILAGHRLARAEMTRGRAPFLVFLSDGRGNLTRDGKNNRDRAKEETAHLAKQLRAEGWPSLFLDTSRRPNPAARHLSDLLGARYKFLPHVSGQHVSTLVRDEIGRR